MYALVQMCSQYSPLFQLWQINEKPPFFIEIYMNSPLLLRVGSHVVSVRIHCTEKWWMF